MKKLAVALVILGIISSGMYSLSQVKPEEDPCACFCRYCAVTLDDEPVICRVWERNGNNCHLRWKKYLNRTHALCGCDCVILGSCKPIGSWSR